MKYRTIFIAIVAVVLATLACQLLSSTEPTPYPTSTPFPTHTPDLGDPSFEVEFVGLHPCGDSPNYASFKIENTSKHTFKSVSLWIDNIATNASVYEGTINQGFIEPGGCPPGESTLLPNSTTEVAVDIGTPNPGSEFWVVIELCSDEAGKGECIQSTLSFAYKKEGKAEEEEAEGGQAEAEGEQAFELSYIGTHPCAEWPHYAVFEIIITSDFVFESEKAFIRDITNDTVVYPGYSNDKPFVEKDGCPPGNSTLEPGNTGYSATNIKEPEPGTEFVAELTLCTQDDAKGDCFSQTVTFVFEE